MAGNSSDGDSRLLRSMKINTRLGQIRPVGMPSIYNCSLPEIVNVQDPTHAGLKMRNKLLQSSALLPMGNRQVSISHLKLLIAKFPKSHHGLVLNDICPDDRQNFKSLEKVMSSHVTQYLQDNIPESEATALYLKMCQYVTSAFMDAKLTPLVRVYRIWFSIMYLRIWRNWVRKIEKDSKSYTVAENFVTSNTYECIELNGHALIQLITKFRDEGKSEQFIPVLFSSQPCESTFRQFRSMTSIYWTKINSSLREMFHIVGRIELQNYITHYKIPEVIFPRSQKKTPKMESYVLPSNDQIFNQMYLARDDAISMAKTFGIHFSNKEDLTCQLRVCEPEGAKLNGNNDPLAAAEVTTDSLCESIGQINLKNGDEEVSAVAATYELYGLRDYTDQNIVINELCPFTKVMDKDGQSKVVRKSSVLWALTNTKYGLSNDRLQRVQGTALEKANKRTLHVQHTPDQVPETDKQIVWRDQNVYIGDWCFFVKSQSSKSKDDLLVGQVVAFRY